ncbi:MAG: cardiolipin synthase [Deltaproteobacteria bacterium]|nr:cardiolipin synthase [Deltaproteobacteria bacterium]
MDISVWIPWFITALSVGVACVSAGHALIYKRDPRSATLWVLVISLLPLGGSVLYVLFGINRVHRRARRLRGTDGSEITVPADGGEVSLTPISSHQGLSHLVETVSGLPLTADNSVRPLFGGAQAYPCMLDAIARARYSVVLSSYIFDRTGIGKDFIEALDDANRRGVQVRVLIDDVHVRLVRTSACGALKLPVASFNPPIIPARLYAANLRNHRKILVVDGSVGFTGGMNIHRPCWCPDAPHKEWRDLHFCVEGPVVAHLAQVFARDWFETVNENIEEDFWGATASPVPGGTALARGIEAGPDETTDRIRWTFMGALSAARQSVRIWTPYFAPDQAILAALGTAALRGVEVDVLIPATCNHALVQWAARAHYWQVLEHGARIFERPGPFDHSKLMIVDGQWICMGSANWDARSLRLNFELNVEVIDAALAAGLEAEFLAVRSISAPVTAEDMRARPLPLKLRDGAARLFTPIV